MKPTNEPTSSRAKGQELASVQAPPPPPKPAADPVSEIEVMNTEQLVAWLEKNLGSRFESVKPDFLAQRIDGKCFLQLSHELIKEISANSLVGDRLHLLALREDFFRAHRVARRSQIIMELKEVHLQPPGVKGSVVLSHSNLKLIYTSETKNKTSDVPVESGKKPKTEQTRIIKSRYVDLIDLLTIEDVDLEETTDVKTLVTYEQQVRLSIVCI